MRGDGNKAVIDNLADIVEKVRSGDATAFTTLVNGYSGYVYRTAFALMHNPQDAEDIVQEAFLKVYRSIGQLQESYAFHTWLTRLVTNLCLDRLKKHTPTPVAEISYSASSRDITPDWDQHLMVIEAVKQLNIEHREVLVMREWQGYDYKEIAAMLKIPLGTVKSRIYAARLHLKQILNNSGYIKE